MVQDVRCILGIANPAYIPDIVFRAFLYPYIHIDRTFIVMRNRILDDPRIPVSHGVIFFNEVLLVFLIIFRDEL